MALIPASTCAALTEIDENLIRRELTDSQRAKLVAKRKAAYEAVHGPAKAASARGANRAMGRNVTANLADTSFAKDTAAKTGRSERSIQRDATRAKALGDDLDRIAGTSLDTGAQIDALAKMTPEQRDPSEVRQKPHPVADRQVIKKAHLLGSGHQERLHHCERSPFRFSRSASSPALSSVRRASSTMRANRTHASDLTALDFQRR